MINYCFTSPHTSRKILIAPIVQGASTNNISKTLHNVLLPCDLCFFFLYKNSKKIHRKWFTSSNCICDLAFKNSQRLKNIN